MDDSEEEAKGKGLNIMDKNAIIQSVMGAVIVGSLAYVFSSIGTLKHNQDTQTSQTNTRMEQVESEQKDIWNKYNSDDKQKDAFVKMFYTEKIDRIQSDHQQENKLNEFKIEYYKNQ